jgi:hypothetical protein
LVRYGISLLHVHVSSSQLCRTLPDRKFFVLTVLGSFGLIFFVEGYDINYMIQFWALWTLAIDQLTVN